MAEVDLTRIVIPPGVLELVPGSLARRLGALPVAFDGETLQVAVRDAEDFEILDRIEEATGLEVRAVQVVDPSGLDLALRRYYTDATSAESGAAALLNELLNQAVQMRASDLHIDPTPRGGVVRVRVDGRLANHRELSRQAAEELVSCVKVLARLNIAERRSPLDGNISMPLVGGEVSLRVATIPTVHGERLCLRLLSSELTADLQDLGALGFSSAHQDLLRRVLAQPHGMVYLSGPTGSGKTTTLYALLRYLSAGGERHIISVEDPVESMLAGVTQIPVDSQGDRVRFHKVLRSVLRHDPDIILIGETRDEETAQVALNAALTGHLLLSTVHANRAAGVPARLLELGVKPFLLASALRVCIAQRLVRRPCSHCLQWDKPRPEERELLGLSSEDGRQIPRPAGCGFCQGRGHAGRMGIFEIVPVDVGTRQLIQEQATEDQLAERLHAEQRHITLVQDGAEKVLQGLTTVAELKLCSVEL